MDNLSSILNLFSISTGVFYSGKLCGLSAFNDPESQVGHLHLLKKGRLTTNLKGQPPLVFDQPTLLFYPKPTPHTIEADNTIETDIVCAEVYYGAGPENPLTMVMPPLINRPLMNGGRLQEATEWLFEEAFNQHDARQKVMNRLCEVIIIYLLRDVISSNQVNRGMMSGLAHSKLSKPLDAMHQSPQKNWTLEHMSQLATMSRAQFALLFKQTVGQSPGDYLARLRIEMAKGLLQQGKPVGWVANEVGYGNASALARVFRSKTGESPKAWQKKQAS